MGPDPDRIFIIGAGAVRGVGVASHELGIGGHLARRLSAYTGRGADVELLGVPGLTVPAAARLLDDVELSRFDALVVVLGTREAVGLRPVWAWGRDIRAFLDGVTAIAPPALAIFVAGIASLPSVLPFGRFFGPIVSRQIERLNAETREACRAAGIDFVPFDSSTEHPGATSTYAAWADVVASHMHTALDAAVSVPHARSTDEELRQASLDAMDILGGAPTPELQALARVAKDLFGVSGAAVNLIDRDRQHMKAASGLERIDMPRSDSFCAVTIEYGGALVIEDTRLDARFSGFPAVQDGLLFYAGYPVEAPNGQRVGTLCLFDTRPRTFTDADKSLLRELALRVQAELWAHGPVPAR